MPEPIARSEPGSDAPTVTADTLSAPDGGKLHFEDFPRKVWVEFGHKPVSEAEIVAFAEEFDFQPHHMDPEVTARSLLGGLAASGWHTCCIGMRMICDGYLLRSASLGANHVEEVKWLKPVRPGDVLSGRFMVLDARTSRSKPALGICHMLIELANQRQEVVLSWKVFQFLTRRQTGALP